MQCSCRVGREEESEDQDRVTGLGTDNRGAAVAGVLPPVGRAVATHAQSATFSSSPTISSSSSSPRPALHIQNDGRVQDRAAGMAERPTPNQLHQGRAMRHRRRVLSDHGFDLWSVSSLVAVVGGRVITRQSAGWTYRRCANDACQDERKA